MCTVCFQTGNINIHYLFMKVSDCKKGVIKTPLDKDLVQILNMK